MQNTPRSTDAQPPRHGPRTGREIAGKYRLGDLLGKGGDGEVYSALQIDLQREVAVKVHAGVRQDADARARFVRETRIAAEMHHPGIVQIYDAGVDEEGSPYCVMELLEGETLAARLARSGPFEAAEAVALTAGLSQALQAVHDKGFLHRDVKPSNVFLARRADGGMDPKLIDFGIAKRVALDAKTQRRLTTLRGMGPKETALDIIVGTPRYLSPEQVLGGKLDARSDIHALATTLYEMLAGTPPFQSEELTDVFAQIALAPAEPIAVRAPERAVPAALDRAILRALAKDPAQRPARAADFAASLWSALAEAKLGDAALDEATAGAPSPARRRFALGVAAGLTVVAAAFAAVAIGRGPPAPAHLAPAALPAPPAPAPQTSVSAGATVIPGTAVLPEPPAADPTAPRPALPVGRRTGRKGTDLKTPY